MSRTNTVPYPGIFVNTGCTNAKSTINALLAGIMLGSMTIIPIEPNGVTTVSMSIPAIFLSRGKTAAVNAPEIAPSTVSSLLRSNYCCGLTKSTGFCIGAEAS